MSELRVSKVTRFQIVLGVLVALGLALPACGQQASQTLLSVSVGGAPVVSVAAKTAVTLTASVTAGASLVTRGQVLFCDAAYPYCSDIHVVGTAQITSAGTAKFKVVPGPGSHAYKAIFKGTNSNGRSTSPSVPLIVAALAQNTSASTVLQPSGLKGNYTLTAIVSAAGFPTPTGSVNFLDTANSNYQLATGVLSATGATEVAFRRAGQTLTSYSPVSVALADFNEDGVPDLVSVNSNGSVDIFLGKGDGTFARTTLSGVQELQSVVTGDFDSDGNADFAVSTTRGIVTIYLGNGDGTFRLGQTYTPTNERAGGGFLAIADFNGDGVPDLAVTIYTSGGAGQHAVSVLLGNGDGTFTTSPSASKTADAVAILSTDLNGDGKADVVVANGLANSLTVLLGNGDGSFAAPSTIATPGLNVALSSADLNGDGVPDLVLEDSSDPPTILLGKGNGTFTTLAPDPNITAYPYTIGLADVNGDGVPDLILPDVQDFVGTINIYLGRGDGTFTFDTSSPAMTGYDAVAIATADFDGHGRTDFALLMQEDGAEPVGVIGNQIAVWLSEPFTTAIASVTNVSPVGTGEHDLVANYLGDMSYASSVSPSQGVIAQLVPTSSSLSVSPTTSTFGQSVTLTLNLAPFTAQDHSAGSTVTFMSGSKSIGTGTVANGVATLTTTALAAGYDNLSAVYGGDINFAASPSNVVSYFVAGAPNRTGTTTSLSLTAGGAPVTSVPSRTLIVFTATVTGSDGSVPTGQVNFCDATAPFCSDVHLLGSAPVTRAGTATIRLAPTVGLHTFKAVFVANSSYLGSSSSNATLQVASLSTGPTINTLVASGQPGNYTLTATINARPNVLPSGLVSFADTTNANYPLGSAALQVAPTGLNVYLATTISTPKLPYTLAEADFNGDGLLDVAVNYNGTVSVFLGKGDGSFNVGAPISFQTSGSGITVGDVNGDGCPDVVAVGYNETQGSYYFEALPGNCDGTFGPPILSKPLAFPGYFEYGATAILLTDLNGDGKPDVAFTNGGVSANFVIAALGNGDGTFNTMSMTPTGVGPFNLVSADYNSDGHPDIVTSNAVGSLSFLFGNGDGTFTTGVDLSIGGGAAFGLVTADFNGDGKADLAATESQGNKVAVLLSNGDGTFTTAPSVSVGSGPYPLGFADFNGDGIADLAVGNTQDGTVSVLLGKGDGTFQPVVPATLAGSVGSALITGDLNSDGVPDLLLSSGNSDALTTLLAASQTTATITGVSIVGTGTHYAQASYPGDTANLPSLSNLAPLTAERVPTALGLAVSPGSSTYGQSVTLTATVAPTSAQSHMISGTVSFMNGATVLGTVSINSNGVASVVTSSLPAGTDSLTATYNGDTNFAPSSSTALTYQVVPAAQAITFPQPSAPAFAGTSVMLTAAASSGLPVVYSVISGPAVVAGSVLSYTGIGTVVIEADQSGGSGYLAAPPVQDTVSVVSLSEPVKTTSPVISTVVTFASAGTLGSIHALTQGAQNLDFNFVPGGSCAPGTTYSAGQTCSVQFTFTPTRPGLRYGGITLTTTSGALLGNAYISGTGMGPQVNWRPGQQLALGTGLSSPNGVAVDGNGNAYVAEFGKVVEIAPSGAMTTFPISTGDLMDVAVDGSGNLFVANQLNGYGAVVNEILAVNGSIPATPMIRTIAAGFITLHGIAVDGNGDLFLTQSYSTGTDCAIYEIPSVNGNIPAAPNVLTLATSFGASTCGPSGVAADASGDLFVSDWYANSVYELLAVNGSIPATPAIRTLAKGFNAPFNVALDAVGDVFVADFSNSAVKEIVAVNGSIPAINPTILKLGSGFVLPTGVAVDGSGNVFVSDTGLTQIVKLDFADPPSLNFANTAVGSTSSDSPQTVTLTNGGNEPLLFNVPTSGGNPTITPGFTIANGSTCPQLTASSSVATLAAGNSCNYQVSFTPSAGGLDNGFLVPTDNNLNVVNATQTVPLNGTGTTIAPGITFTVPNQIYGNPPFTVAATSNSPGAFTYSVVSGPATISGTTVTLTGTGTVQLQVVQAASGIYSSGTQTATFVVSKESQIITFVSLASPVNYGTPPVTLSATASSGLSVTFSVLSGPATVSGNILTFTGIGTVVVAADQAGNVNYSAAPEVTHTVVVVGRIVTIGLTATPNPVFVQNPVTFTATVSSSFGTPTGTMKFLDGTNPIGSTGLSGGVAVIAISTLGVGAHSITAAYSGDSSFAPLVSSPVNVIVQDFSFVINNPDVTIPHGGTAVYNLVVSSVGAVGMAANIGFTIAGSPDHSTITFSPKTIPTGSGTTNVTLTIQTPDYPVGPWSQVRGRRGITLALGIFGTLLLPFGRKRRCLGMQLKRVAFMASLFFALASLSGCGSGWKTQSYSITVTASSGSLSHSVNASLTSQQ